VDQLNEQELRAELRRARLLGSIATNAGEADAEALWASVVRSITNEALSRRITLD
jgi:hypothetical protein